MTETPEQIAKNWTQSHEALEKFKRDLHAQDRLVSLWREFTVVVPTLFDALKKYAHEAEVSAGRVAPLVKAFNAGKGSASDLAAEMGKFQTAWRKCAELHAALLREQAIVEQANPELVEAAKKQKE